MNVHVHRIESVLQFSCACNAFSGTLAASLVGRKACRSLFYAVSILASNETEEFVHLHFVKL